MRFSFATLVLVLEFIVPNVAASPARRPPAPKPLPPSLVGGSSPPSTGDAQKLGVAYHKSCGLDIPTRVAWEQGKNKEVGLWVGVQWIAYLNAGNYGSFPMYMRDRFAPDAPPSTMVCDGIGPCTIATCLNIDKSLPIHDRQMAYYVFEIMAHIAHNSAAMLRATIDATDYQQGNMKTNVDMFTSAKYIGDKLMERKKQEAAAMSAVTAITLMTTALMAGVPELGQAGTLGSTMGTVGLQAGEQTIKRIGTINNAATLMTSSFIGLSGLIMDVRNDPYLSQDLVALMSVSWNELAHKASDSISSDLIDLMIGAKNAQDQDLPQLIISGEFIEADPQIYIKLKAIIGTYYQAAMINSLWKFERAYILDTNSKDGNCHTDDRGASEVRVCLDEYPGHTYWLYSIDQSEEDDKFKDDQALVHGPSGYRNFFENRSSNVHGLTKEDIVRSSLWIDANNFEDKVNAEKPDLLLLMRSMVDANKDLGKVPGAFSLPICRNPDGEAISSVWDKKGRNYPCKCGEVPWKQKHYDSSTDTTRKFLERTGFKYSEDWEDYCSDHNHCKGENSIDWNFAPGPEGKKIPKKLKHPFKTCKESKEHRIGKPEKDREANKGKRGIEKRTWQEVQRAQLELWAKQLEERQKKQERQRTGQVASLYAAARVTS
jgi:hypothetical protein